MKVRLYSDLPDYKVKNKRKIAKFLEKVISDEGKRVDDLVYVITSDEELIKINKEFLNHNYYTDVISFDYGYEDVVRGEVYISIDTVRRNAREFKVSVNNEMLRVLIHGALHLAGYDDGTEERKAEIHKREDFWINKFREE